MRLADEHIGTMRGIAVDNRLDSGAHRMMLDERQEHQQIVCRA